MRALPRSLASLHACPLLALLAAAGCASAPQRAQQPQPSASSPPGEATLDAPAGDATSAASQPAPQRTPGDNSAPGGRLAQARPEGPVIRRAELRRYLAAGPQRFIQKVRVRPAFRRGRFYGWRIVAYGGPGPIRVGDIVHSVNGHSLERPDQFMATWGTLRRADRLVIRLHRAGEPVILRYAIVDGPDAAPARTSSPES